MVRERYQHYLFAYKLLPTLFDANPEKIISDIKNSKGAVLHALWHRVGQDLLASELVKPDGLSCKTASPGNDVSMAVVVMPPPQVIPEAYFVALVFRPEKKSLFSSQKAVKRMFALERSLNSDHTPLPILCELDSEGYSKGKILHNILS